MIDIRSKAVIDEFRLPTLAGVELSSVELVKDLGIVIEQNLSFSNHILTTVAKAKRLIFLLFKVFVSRDPKYLIKAYKTYVMPILEFNSPVWSPSKLKDILSLESVQRLFTRRIQGMKDLDYKSD